MNYVIGFVAWAAAVTVFVWPFCWAASDPDLQKLADLQNRTGDPVTE